MRALLPAPPASSPKPRRSTPPSLAATAKAATLSPPPPAPAPNVGCIRPSRRWISCSAVSGAKGCCLPGCSSSPRPAPSIPVRVKSVAQTHSPESASVASFIESDHRVSLMLALRSCVPTRSASAHRARLLSEGVHPSSPSCCRTARAGLCRIFLCKTPMVSSFRMHAHRH